MTKNINQQTELHAYFTPEGFILEDLSENASEDLQEHYEAFEVSKMEALYALGFKDKAQWFSPAMEFLYHIAELFVKC